MTARTLGLVFVLSLLAAAPASADITAFIGANTTPANRQTRGAAVGVGFLIVAFEFEYAFTPENLSDPTTTAPSLRTGMGNVLLQSPVKFLGIQPYFTTGGGLFQEKLGTHSETNVGLNSGGGAKINLLGPIRLRVDYRVFKLGSGALYSPAHRIYAGLNLKF
jgi:opacity protein-like surface antigen